MTTSGPARIGRADPPGAPASRDFQRMTAPGRAQLPVQFTGATCFELSYRPAELSCAGSGGASGNEFQDHDVLLGLAECAEYLAACGLAARAAVRSGGTVALRCSSSAAAHLPSAFAASTSARPDGRIRPGRDLAIAPSQPSRK